MQMFNAEQLQEKWAPILDYEGMDPIRDSHRRAVTAILLENQEKEMREERQFLYETPTNFTTSSGATAGMSGGASGALTGFDPVLISLIRRCVRAMLTRLEPKHSSTSQILHSQESEPINHLEMLMFQVLMVLLLVSEPLVSLELTLVS
jgi:hypothetical protein